MRHLRYAALAWALMLGSLVAWPAAAQQVSAQGTVSGQNWRRTQNFDEAEARRLENSPLARDRAARAARQAQFNRPYSGLPIRPETPPAR
ncbi:hypothetical protein [Roseococcus pinisoli]|uniref:DUF4148 domain-containing protein n=1 Tax=Roseococcus pinisoli TaxID=2835040 RepID=A0ABS5Q971_9PROT|nr:hypothetical protein [Roseococcus pinisoli]MBS7810017.1 hypothetical protein [Roseococcus pinisoli]